MITRFVKAKSFKVLMIFMLVLPLILISPAEAAGPYPYSSGSTEVADALDYLRGQQGTDGGIGDFTESAWAVMAIAAAGEDPNSWQVDSNPTVVDYLADNAGSATTGNDYARTILAIAAADLDPTDFGGRDFLYLLEDTHDGAQFGNASYLNDDFWGVMGLVAAGRDPAKSSIIQDSVAFILANQSSVDGGWSWGVGGESDVDNTAAAVMALIAAGESASSTPIADALDYIKSAQVESGGFESWGSTNSATDSWGIASIAAAGQDPTDAGWQSGTGNDPVDDLLAFRDSTDGFFLWTQATPSSLVQMTSYAIVALLGEPYPVAVLPPTDTEGVTIDVRIEGPSSTVWAGTVTVSDSTIYDDEGGEHYFADPTALGALDEAATLGGFDYTLRDFGWGVALTGIDGEGDWDAGPWWMFIVDGASPSMGADSFILDQSSPPSPPHGEVLFALSSTFAEIPLKVEVDDTTPEVNDPFTVTVTEYDADLGDWKPTADATVHADQSYTTGQNGTVALSIDQDMTVDVYAEKDGYIRSNRVRVIIGEGSALGGSIAVGMTVDIVPAISFAVSPNLIDFGNLGPRDSSAPKSINIINQGSWDLKITVTVIDSAQGLYVQGLEMDDEQWQSFSVILGKAGTKQCEAVLTVPATYPGVGTKEGTIIFWAEDVY